MSNLKTTPTIVELELLLRSAKNDAERQAIRVRIRELAVAGDRLKETR